MIDTSSLFNVRCSNNLFENNGDTETAYNYWKHFIKTIQTSPL